MRALSFVSDVTLHPDNYARDGNTGTIDANCLCSAVQYLTSLQTGSLSQLGTSMTSLSGSLDADAMARLFSSGDQTQVPMTVLRQFLHSLASALNPSPSSASATVTASAAGSSSTPGSNIPNAQIVFSRFFPILSTLSDTARDHLSAILNLLVNASAPPSASALSGMVTQTNQIMQPLNTSFESCMNAIIHDALLYIATHIGTQASANAAATETAGGSASTQPSAGNKRAPSHDNSPYAANFVSAVAPGPGMTTMLPVSPPALPTPGAANNQSTTSSSQAGEATAKFAQSTQA